MIIFLGIQGNLKILVFWTHFGVRLCCVPFQILRSFLSQECRTLDQDCPAREVKLPIHYHCPCCLIFTQQSIGQVVRHQLTCCKTLTMLQPSQLEVNTTGFSFFIDNYQISLFGMIRSLDYESLRSTVCLSHRFELTFFYLPEFRHFNTL